MIKPLISFYVVVVFYMLLYVADAVAVADISFSSTLVAVLPEKAPFNVDNIRVAKILVGIFCLMKSFCENCFCMQFRELSNHIHEPQTVPGNPAVQQ